MAEEEKTSGGFWDGLFGLGAGIAAYDLQKDELEQEKLVAEYNLLELRAEQERAADVSPSTIGGTFLQANKSMLIIAGALLFSGLMIYKVAR